MKESSWAMQSVATRVGGLWIVTRDDAVWGAEFEARWTRQRDRLIAAGGPEVDVGARRGKSSVLSEAARAVRGYFSGELRALDPIPLALEGSEYSLRVWRTVRRIRPGRTSTYSELAKRAHKPGAFRATGRANGSNPCCLFVPCHRVVASDGRLTGYGGGLAAKAWLLTHEGVPNDGARLVD